MLAATVSAEAVIQKGASCFLTPSDDESHSPHDARFLWVFSEKRDFKNTEKDDSVGETRDHQPCDVDPVSRIDPCADEIPFAEKTTGWRNPDHGQRSHCERYHREGRFAEGVFKVINKMDGVAIDQ